VHREFAQVPVWEDGLVMQAGQIVLTDEGSPTALGPEDEVAVEAICNTHAIVRLIEPRVKRVVVSNPRKTRAIAGAKVKTDKVDAEVLCQLLAADYPPAADYLPSAWSPIRPRRRCDGRSPAGRTSSASAPAPPS
jgi:hypothetical protein